MKKLVGDVEVGLDSLEGAEHQSEDLARVTLQKQQLEQQLSQKIGVLQSEIAAFRSTKSEAEKEASDYRLQLEAIQASHAHCLEEAGQLKELLEAKESDLSRMLTSLHIAAAQVRDSEAGMG